MDQTDRSKQIKVLLVEDNSSYAEGIVRLLQFEEDIRVAGQAENGARALDLFDSLHPDVVLVEPGLPDMDSLDLTRRLIEQNLLAQVVLYSHEADSERILEAMDAGAASYVAPYIQDGRLAAAVRKAAERGERMKGATGPLTPIPVHGEEGGTPQGKIVALYAGKGGVGVTTLAVNLAIALQSSETPSVLVDADLQFGDVFTFLNLQPVHTLADFETQLNSLDADLLYQLLLRHDDSGLRIAAAPTSPEQADDITPQGIGKLLEELRRRFAYVIVDTQVYLNSLSLAVLERADLIISPMLPDIPSIKNVRLLMDTMAMLDMPRDHLLLVMNQVDRRDRIRASNVSENLKQLVEHEIPFARDEMMQAVNRGRPILTEGKTSPTASALLKLVGDVKERILSPSQA